MLQVGILLPGTVGPGVPQETVKNSGMWHYVNPNMSNWSIGTGGVLRCVGDGINLRVGAS